MSTTETKTTKNGTGKTRPISRFFDVVPAQIQKKIHKNKKNKQNTNNNNTNKNIKYRNESEHPG